MKFLMRLFWVTSLFISGFVYANKSEVIIVRSFQVARDYSVNLTVDRVDYNQKGMAFSIAGDAGARVEEFIKKNVGKPIKVEYLMTKDCSFCIVNAGPVQTSETSNSFDKNKSSPANKSNNTLVADPAYREYKSIIAVANNRWGPEPLCKNPNVSATEVGMFASTDASGQVLTSGKFVYKNQFMTVYNQEINRVIKNSDGTFTTYSHYHFFPENKTFMKRTTLQFSNDQNGVNFRVFHSEEDGKVSVQNGIVLETNKPTDKLYNCNGNAWAAFKQPATVNQPPVQQINENSQSLSNSYGSAEAVRKNTENAEKARYARAEKYSCGDIFFISVDDQVWITLAKFNLPYMLDGRPGFQRVNISNGFKWSGPLSRNERPDNYEFDKKSMNLFSRPVDTNDPGMVRKRRCEVVR